jgi:hypothetical protein
LGENGVDFEPHEFRSGLSVALVATFRPTVLDLDRSTFYPAEFAKSLHQSGNHMALRRRRARTHETDSWQLDALLRPHREWPRYRAAKRDKEFSPPAVDCHATLPWGSCPRNGGNNIML